MSTNMPSQKTSSFGQTMAMLKEEELEQTANLSPVMTPLRLRGNSGLYKCSGITPLPGPVPPSASMSMVQEEWESHLEEEMLETEDGAAALPFLPILLSSDLRLDVDGYFPQMQASGRSNRPLRPAFEWIARIRKIAPNTYDGIIWYKDGVLSSLPYTRIQIVVSRTLLAPISARVTFSTPGVPGLTLRYAYSSPYFHPINFEFDSTDDIAAPALIYNTGSHPNRPATLPVENLTVPTVFRRAGFNVSVSAVSPKVPIAMANADGKWSDAEMHDAMQAYWSKFGNIPQWALWTFLASLHEAGTGLGGIMFDDIGPNHRQGCSIFVNSFIGNAPAGDPAPAAWVNRMLFWTVVHEMGHCFNLAHSWQKNLGTPWIPLPNEPEARSFMNYPYRVAGGQTAFFSNFDFRFSQGELLFMRHAPYRYVQPGNADWFDHHGFQQNFESMEPKFSLALSFTNGTNTFEFMEPIVAELTLKNISDQPQLVPEKLLASGEEITLVIKKRGKPTRMLVPFVQRCWKESAVVLNPKAELEDSIFLVGQNGWDVAEPGAYTLQASVKVNGQEIISNPVPIMVAPPRNREEEHLAQDYFSDEVGRVLAFDGTMYLTKANEALRDIVEKLPKSRATLHAKIALIAPQAAPFKQVVCKHDNPTLSLLKPSHEEAQRLLAMLQSEAKACASTLGKTDHEYYLQLFRGALEASKKKAGRSDEITVGAGR